MASAARMLSIGDVVAQGSYPKSANVLANIRNLTGLEFVYFRRAATGNSTGQSRSEDPPTSLKERPQPVLRESTLSLTQGDLAILREQFSRDLAEMRHDQRKSASKSIASDRLSHIYESEFSIERMRWIPLSTESGWLVVLEGESRRGDSWIVFALPLVTGLLSSIGIAIVAGWTAKKLSRRIENLQREVAHIAGGEFQKRELEGPEDDVRALQASLYDMGDQLEESRKQIAINERSRLIHLIGSGLAHELRNHLTGARLALQTVDAAQADEESISVCLKQLDLAERQIRRLLAVRSGGDRQDMSPLRLDDIVSSAVDLVRPIAVHRSVALDVFSPSPVASRMFGNIGEVQVRAGASIIGVVLNLLLNAIEAVEASEFTSCSTPEHEGRVELHLAIQLEQGRLQISVRDNGAGPDTEIASTMFEPFATTKREGVGLGLAMCHHVVQSLGGSIDWTRDNAWTEFQVSIPIEDK